MSNLIASFEICEMFASMMSTGIDYSSLEVREEEDIDILCDSDTTIELPTMEEVRAERVKEDALAELIEIQETMAKGMKYIKAASKERDDALQSYIDKKTEFTALMGKLELWTNKYNELSYSEKKNKSASFYQWKSALWTKANPIKDAKNSSYQEYQACKAKVSKYWARWNDLKEQAQTLAEQHNLWHAFFSVVNEEYNLYWSTSDCEELDSLSLLYRSDYSDDLAFSHIEEMKEYDRDTRIDWSFQDKRMESRRQMEAMTDDDWASLLESAPF